MNQLNFHKTPEEIFKVATPEQKILWNHIFLLCGERLSIAQLFYMGPSAGTDFLTYRARRLYFALELQAGQANGAGQTNNPLITLYDQNNNISFYLPSATGYWNSVTTALNYLPIAIESHNLYFSRIALNVYSYVKFVGYRIIY